MKINSLPMQISKNAGAIINRLGSAVLNPNALTGMGVVLVPVTIGLAINATVKATKDSKPNEKEDGFDKARRCWKYYVPVAISGVMCVACIIASNRLSAKERAGLASALAISEEALKQYQDKLAKETGTSVTVEKANVSTIEKWNEDCEPRLQHLPKDEELWCRDKVTGNMFKTTKQKIDIVNGKIAKTREYNDDQKQKALEYSESDLENYTINDMYRDLGVATIEIGDDYFIRVLDNVPLQTGSDLTVNGEFMLTLDYYVTRDIDNI